MTVELKRVLLNNLLQDSSVWTEEGRFNRPTVITYIAILE